MELAKLLDVCRLCLKPHSNNTSIFSDENLINNITVILRVQLRQSKSLSSVICSPCYESVFSLCAFAESVRKNQTYLELLLVDQQQLVVGSCTSAQKAPADPIPAHVAQESELEDEADREDAQLSLEREHAAISYLKEDDHLIRQYVGFRCEICEKQLESFRALSGHCRSEHGTVARVTCCDKRFARKDRLLTHILNHIKPDAFKCDVCALVCKSKAILQVHRRQHLSPEDRAFQCAICEQRFVSRSQLTNHEVTHLPSDQRKHICADCGKTFAFKYALAKHRKLHEHGGKDFVCEICARSYTTEAGLKQHLTSHSEGAQEEQRVQCTACEQWYKNTNTLRLHVRDKHKDNGAHFCATCGKKFPSRNTLAAHIKYVHIRDVRYACDVCGVAFRRRVELREHSARHTGKAPYECDVCGQTFNHSSNYSIHRKNKHPKHEQASSDER